MGAGGDVFPKPTPLPPSSGKGGSEKPYPSAEYTAADNPAHPFLSSPEGSGFYCSHQGGILLRVALPSGLWGGEGGSPERDDEVIPAEIIIVTENTLHGPQQRVPALYTEARGMCRGKFKKDIDIISSSASPREKNIQGP